MLGQPWFSPKASPPGAPPKMTVLFWVPKQAAKTGAATPKTDTCYLQEVVMMAPAESSGFWERPLRPVPIKARVKLGSSEDSPALHAEWPSPEVAPLFFWLFFGSLCFPLTRQAFFLLGSQFQPSCQVPNEKEAKQEPKAKAQAKATPGSQLNPIPHGRGFFCSFFSLGLRQKKEDDKGRGPNFWSSSRLNCDAFR